MKGLILLANYFEDVEALITVDILRRANIGIDLVSMEKDLKVTTAHNVVMECDYLLSDIEISSYDFFVLPGGKAIMKTHLTSNITKKVLDYFMENNKLVCAICAAPMVLGRYGYLKNKNYTIFPGCESPSFEGNLKNKPAVVDGNIITGKACGTTFDFSYEIVKYLLGKKEADKVIKEVYYQK